MPDIDWHRRGQCDYPRHDLYPTRDKYSEQDEKDYLTGWHSKDREMNRAEMLERMARGI